MPLKLERRGAGACGAANIAVVLIDRLNPIEAIVTLRTRASILVDIWPR